MKDQQSYEELAERIRGNANHVADILADPENQAYITQTDQADELELLLLMAIHFERELNFRVAMIELQEEYNDMGHTQPGALH